MNNRIRSRLIGGIAILLVIIISFPYMSKKQQLFQSKEIAMNHIRDVYPPKLNQVTKSRQLQPSLPQIQTLPEAKAGATQVHAVIPAEIQQKIKPIAKTGIALPVKAEQKQVLNGIKNYNIQLVALKNQKKVEELLALLRLHNYHAYIDQRDDTQIRRLFVGPYTSKAKAQSILLDLHNLTRLKGIIITK